MIITKLVACDTLVQIDCTGSKAIKKAFSFEFDTDLADEPDISEMHFYEQNFNSCDKNLISVQSPFQKYERGAGITPVSHSVNL